MLKKRLFNIKFLLLPFFITILINDYLILKNIYTSREFEINLIEIAYIFSNFA